MEAEDTTIVEYFVAATLTNEGKIFEWNPEAQDQDDTKQNSEKLARRHTLSLKKAILGIDAKDGELNLIELATKGLDGEEIRVPLAYLQTGSMYQTSLDLSLPESVVKLSLVKGTGPVHVLGQHTVTTTAVEEDEDEVVAGEESDDEFLDEEVPEPSPKKDENGLNEKKRKNEGEANGELKKVKLGDGEKPVENGSDKPLVNGKGTAGAEANGDKEEPIEVDAPTEEGK